MSFPHNAVEIFEVFQNRCNESYVFLMALLKFCPNFPDILADLAKIHHKKSTKFSKCL